MEKKRLSLEDIFRDDYEEDEEEYGYEDYKEYIEDDIYGDHYDPRDIGDMGEMGDVGDLGAIGDPDRFDVPDDDDDDEELPPLPEEDLHAAPQETVKSTVTAPAVTKTEKRKETPAPAEAPAAEPAVQEVKPVVEEKAVTPEAQSEKPADQIFSDEPPKGDNSVTLEVPLPVMEIIDILREHTYTCYLVGECVYLMYIGERVMDFDIACNASLDRIIAIFDERFKTREDLLSRGELIIINGAMGISVAPYRSRIDGNGKPIYCKTIDEDMHRRTFTSETVAYNPYAGIYDPFGGLACISEEKTVLKAIDEEKFERLEHELSTRKKRSRDEPKKVVIEALRENPECILIAMQKYARGEAEISPYTLKNINDNAELIDMMMPTEISRYFRRIILGRRVTETLLNFREVVFRIFPVLRDQLDFDQKSDYQEYTLYEHTAKAVGYAFPDYAVRLALLLHGIGKYDCAADRGEYMTYYGHSERGVMLAKDVFDEYEADTSVVERVLFMIMHHDDHISPDNVVQYTEFCGMEYTRLLLLLQSANIRAKSSDPVNERVSSTLRQLADRVAALGTVPRAQTRRTATIEGLRGITDMLGRRGV
ncbi:MAG: hypothetical protein IK093_11110 [Ruminiclostridium sp.]|nr:hypothetical protein [Ruminiclostridium sp.]